MARQVDQPIVETLAKMCDRIEGMTPDEFKDSLIEAGIIDADGKLVEAYRGK